MKKAVLFLCAAAALGTGPAQAAPRLTPEQQLAKAIEGRVAGTPVSCIDPRVLSGTQVIDRTAIVYGSGRTIYVQQPVNPQWLRNDDILITELRGTTQLCNVDIIRLLDRNGFWPRGFVNLNKFVPYTKAPTPAPAPASAPN